MGKGKEHRWMKAVVQEGNHSFDFPRPFGLSCQTTREPNMSNASKATGRDRESEERKEKDNVKDSKHTWRPTTLANAAAQRRVVDRERGQQLTADRKRQSQKG